MLHIYTTKMQPATDYIDQCGEVAFRGDFEPEKRIYTDCCGKKRKAKDCVVQCYYDGLRVWCAEGRGCKNPQTIAAKRRREHMKRSRAQQARRVREAAEVCEKYSHSLSSLAKKDILELAQEEK